MSMPRSTWEQTQYNLVQDFLDLFLPPRYPFAVETNYPKTASMEALMKNRFNSLELPEPKLLHLGKLMEEWCPQDFPDKCADFAVLYTYNVLEGFGHGLACSLQSTAFEGLKQLANTWGLYLAKEVERFFRVWQLFTAFTDFIFDLFNIFCQIPAKELGEAIRESITPAYLRAGETIAYEVALFDNNPARMKESLDILEASDAELEREIANMFRGYSTEQLGRQMQRMEIDVVSQLRQVFSGNEFKEKFNDTIPTAALITYRNMSFYIGRRLSQNLQHDPQRTNRLLDAINHHREIPAVFEQYRYAHSWGGDSTKAICLAWQAVAPKYFSLPGKVEDIEEDDGQEKLIGVAQGLKNYTDKNRAIEALTDAFLGKLGAYLVKAAKNEETDYVRKQMSDGNRALTEAKHAADLRHPDSEEDEELSDEEILSREKEKYYPARDSIVEELESKETIEEWYNSLTEREKTVIDLKSADYTEAKIADMTGISQQRVSELLQQSVRKYQRLKIHR